MLLIGLYDAKTQSLKLIEQSGLVPLRSYRLRG